MSVEPHSSPVSRVPIHHVLSVGDFSCGRKTLPVKSAVVTSLIGMTLRIVQNNTTLTTPARRKIESLVDETRLRETIFKRKYRQSCLPEHRDGKRNGVANPFTQPQDSDREEEDRIRDLNSKR